MKKHTMLLLWLGAAISISEIYTGGLLAPLGFARGLVAVLLGHAIGAALLAFGGYVSFSRKLNAMDSIGFSFGRLGGKLVALCNMAQLAGWIIILVVQAGNVIALVLGLPFWAATLALAVLQMAWAVLFGRPGGNRFNDVAVALLAILCALFFIEAWGLPVRSGEIGAAGMSFALGIELSIAMPVSWLPLIGDYSRLAEDKTGATAMPFIGYFIGSSLMYAIGLFIGISSNDGLFSFIASSRFRYVACAVVLLSTVTTNFVALYSAAISSRQFVKTKSTRLPILVIGTFVLLVAVFFPTERFSELLEHFLSAIGTVFVPVYTVVFFEFVMKRPQCEKRLNAGLAVIAVIGMIGYRLFNVYGTGLPAGAPWIPTVMTVLLVCMLCAIARRVQRAA
jgi:putative hydroxymethylpyrimidine transporter CytX